jgi:hypothetical protein
MIRYLLLLLYVLTVLEATFDLGLGLVPGLSAKNLLLYALLFAILARAVLVNTDIYIPLLSIHVAFLVFVSYATVSWMLHSLFDPTYPAFDAFKALKSGMVDKLLFLAVFFFGSNNYKEAKELLIFALHLIALLSVATILDISPFVDIGFMETDADGRVRGPIGESNQYGAFMVFFVPIFGAMALGSKGVARIMWWIIFFCGFGLIVSTGSRGAYAGVILGSLIGLKFVFPFFDRRKIWRTARAMVVIRAVISVGIGFANIDLARERIEQSTTSDVHELTSGRSDVWRATVLVQAERPVSFLVGQGWNAHSNSGIWKSTHNTYLLILFELGAIGLILFAVLIAIVIAQLRVLLLRTTGKERTLMGGVAFGLFGVIVSITFVELHSPWFYIWSILGMSLRIAYEKDKEFRREEQQQALAGSAHLVGRHGSGRP